MSLETLANEIRTIYQSDPGKAETLIEAYIEQRLRECSPGERLTLIGTLTHHFERVSPKTHPDLSLDSEEISELFSLLLGRRLSIKEFSSEELLKKLAHSLNTVFDTLNQIVGVINTTLSGNMADFQTIRHIIGSNLAGEAPSHSLQDYLDQIRKAFLITHNAFKQAAETKVGEILAELNPDRIEATVGGGLKFGPLRKAELFDTYKEKFQACKSCLESGRFTEELSREFERMCQKLYRIESRRDQ